MFKKLLYLYSLRQSAAKSLSPFGYEKSSETRGNSYTQNEWKQAALH